MDFTAWERRVCDAFRALQRGVAIQSVEEDRVLDSLVKIAAYLKQNGHERKICIWSCLSTRDLDLVIEGETLTYKFTEKTPVAYMDAVLGFARSKDEGFLVLCDPAPFLNEPGDVRALREALHTIKIEAKCKSIVLVGPSLTVPAEVVPDFWVTEYALPSRAELLSVFESMARAYQKSDAHKGIKFEPEQLGELATACIGLTERQCRQIVANAVVAHVSVDERAVKLAHEEKAQAVKRSGIMEIQQPRGGLELLGGLTKFKDYVHEIDDLFSRREAARAFGCQLPSGILCMGISGCGKSLAAEALAGHWKLPLLRLEMGRVFGSLIGQSEAQLREVFALAKAVAPCLVFIDEFEKGIGGGGELDGNTTGRVKQALLSWLQEKPEDVIVVATVNSLAPFEKSPEMLRAGRFDAIYFFDLPDMRARMDILKIHLEKSRHLPTPFPPGDNTVKQWQNLEQFLMDAAQNCMGYSGAELAAAVQVTVRRLFKEGESITGTRLKQALKEQVPLSVTMKAQLDELRAYCKSGKARPAGALIENDQADRATFGLPILVK